MASGHLKTPHQQAEHMAAPTSPCDIVQKTLANSEPSTHGTSFDVTGAGGPMKIAPFRQAHGDIDSLGVRVGGLAYSGDFSDLPPEALQDLDDLDLWIVDALRYRPHPSHFNVDDALAWIERVKPRRAVLTHLHGDLDYATLSAKLPPGVEVAYDGMTLDVLL